ncbi:MAG: DNA polymerase III subunit delta' [Alphaproteobacteria bacterium]|nr:DNA polymerase III subunit delta' [Alphaproteobacteria bacterium]
MSKDTGEKDQAAVHPAPRLNAEIVGQGAAETALLDAHRSGRLPHAWLLTGPKGVGKATLAYRFARFLLADGANGAAASLFGDAPAPATSLGIEANHPVFHRMASGGHADFRVLERTPHPKTGKMRSEIVIGDARDIIEFMHLTPAESSRRVVIVDSADDMNRNTANALLKVLEEPPASAVLILVSHSPARLLPTIRSRCRKLALSLLSHDEVREGVRKYHPDLKTEEAEAIAHLGEGSLGRALEIAERGGLELYHDLVSLLDTLPRLDFAALQEFAGTAAEDDQSFDLSTSLLRGWHARMLKGAATGVFPPGLLEGEAALMRRLAGAASLDRWFEVWDKNDRLFRRADSANLDHRQVLLNAFLAFETAARP